MGRGGGGGGKQGWGARGKQGWGGRGKQGLGGGGVSRGGERGRGSSAEMGTAFAFLSTSKRKKEMDKVSKQDSNLQLCESQVTQYTTPRHCGTGDQPCCWVSLVHVHGMDNIQGVL